MNSGFISVFFESSLSAKFALLYPVSEGLRSLRKWDKKKCFLYFSTRLKSNNYLQQMQRANQNNFTINFLKEISLARALGVIILISTVAFLFLVWLLYYKGGSDYSSSIIESLPALNALFNGASTVLLLFGYRAILKKQYLTHMWYNLTAFVTSTLFLISYVIYHNFHGSTTFPGEGLIRPIYFSILVSHIILSALVVPMILTSFYLAFAGKIKIHRKVSKITLPIWLYVSVTGVMIFFILNAYV